MTFSLKMATLTLSVAASLLATSVAQAIPAPKPARVFCASNPGECAGGGSSVVTATPQLLSLVEVVNRKVNASIDYENDTSNVWSLAPSRGDCEDFALTKRSVLIGQGVDASALRLAYTFTSAGAPHAVLIVRTSSGDLVLDNVSNGVRSVQSSGYRILAMSGSNLLRWS